MSATDDLCAAWSAIDLDSKALALSDDLMLLRKNPRTSVTHTYEASLEEAAARDGDERLHLSLLPQPYIGDLNKARVILLMLNPGLGPMDYYAELSGQRDGAFRSAVVSNLRQEGNRTYPFFFLDPAFLWHPGATFWRKRLNWIVRELSAEYGRTYDESLRYVAQHVCCLQLVPYHSAEFGLTSGIVKQLPSTKLVVAAAREIAAGGHRLLAVMRKDKLWNLKPSEFVVQSAPAHRRGAFVTSGSDLANRILVTLSTFQSPSART